LAASAIRRAEDTIPGSHERAKRTIECCAQPVLGNGRQERIGLVEYRPDLGGDGGIRLGKHSAIRDKRPGIAGGHQVEKLLTDRGHAVHVDLQTVPGNLDVVIDLHARRNAITVEADARDQTDGDAAVGHVGPLVESAAVG